MKLLNNSQMKIIKEIYRNPGINLREIIDKTKLSPNYVSKYVNNLVDRGVLREERLEKKRVYLRRFFFNFKSSLAKNLFVIYKEEEKEEFFGESPEFKPVFNQIIEDVRRVEFILIYGSYARFAEDKESDLDVLIVGNIRNKEKIMEIFVSLDVEPSIKIESLKDFIKRKDDSLHQQILKDNILIYDSGGFLNFLEGEFG